MNKLPILVIAFAFLASTAIAVAQEKPVAPTQPKDERLSRETPEGTLRVFTLGVMLGNEQLVKATIVPVEAEELKYLLTKPAGEQPSAKVLKERVASLKVRALKAGDKFTLPGGKEIVVGAEEVTDERLILVLEGSLIPTRLYKSKDFWWVDADPTIAARKAAASIRQKREQP